jgi:UDP-N-acetylmuramate dehydrogenase
MLDNNITNDSLTNMSLAKIVREIRKSVLPNHHKIFNAGSFFKNPIVNKNNINQETYNLDQLVYWELENKMLKVGAARLIELIKDKIPASENVSLYEKHSLVLVTNGKAIQSEVLTYANAIQNIVYETFNINLDIEPNIIY